MRKMIGLLMLSGLLGSVGVYANDNLPVPGLTQVQDLNRIVAIANDEAITQTELDMALMAAHQQMAQAGITPPDEKTLRSRVLEQLIYQKLELQLAKRNNVKATPEELQTAVERVAAENHISVDELKQKLREEGFSYEKFVSQIRKQIVVSKLQRQALGNTITITKKDIATFRAQHPAEKGATQYHIETILTPLPETPTADQIAQAKAKALDILKAAQENQNFDALIEKNPGSMDLGWRNENDLPQIFVSQIAKMHNGEIAGPIQAPNGFHVIKLIEARTESHNFTDEQIQNFIFQQKMNIAMKPWLAQLRKAAYIQILVN